MVNLTIIWGEVVYDDMTPHDSGLGCLMMKIHRVTALNHSDQQPYDHGNMLNAFIICNKLTKVHGLRSIRLCFATYNA